MLSSQSFVPSLVQVMYVGGRFVEVQVRKNIGTSTDVSPKLSKTISGAS